MDAVLVQDSELVTTSPREARVLLRVFGKVRKSQYSGYSELYMTRYWGLATPLDTFGGSRSRGVIIFHKLSVKPQA